MITSSGGFDRLSVTWLKDQLYRWRVLAALVFSIPLNTRVLEKLEQQATAHPAGYKYLYLFNVHLFGVPLWEALIFWLIQGAATGEHDHQESNNFSKVIQERIEERKFRVSRGEIILRQKREVRAGHWLRTAKFQIHELQGLGPKTAIVLSLYVPGRKF
ncbi:hypothetical protein ACE1CD_36735 [Aerosakkonema sp. BLCC-F183]|uniref:hypothetical protein n=1 Tax=Aerosakkonema sp. BLCC-F183 TaxID=3342834 RepID=UPI0035B6EE6E